MKQLFLFAFLFSIAPLSLSAQEIVEKKYPSFSIEVVGGLTTSFMYKTPVVFVLCFEGCYPYQQDMYSGENLFTSFNMSFNRSHKVAVGFNYYDIGYNEKLTDGFFGGSWDNVQKCNVAGVEFSHHLTFLHADKLGVSWINGFGINHPLNDSYDSQLRYFVFDHITKIGIEHEIFSKISLKGYGFFRSAVSRYNKKDTWTHQINDYYPYSYGLLLGLSYRI